MHHSKIKDEHLTRFPIKLSTCLLHPVCLNFLSDLIAHIFLHVCATFKDQKCCLSAKRDNSFLSAYNNIYVLLTVVKCRPFSLAENFSKVISISKTLPSLLVN